MRATPDSPWTINPKAENVGNLPRAYYENGIQGKSEAWIRVNLGNLYGYVADGMPVWADYRDDVHCKVFELDPRLPLHIGLDFGLTPAAIIGQRMLTGQWRWRYEVVTTDTGVQRFAAALKTFLAANCQGFKIASITGDPAGDQRQLGDNEERTVFALLEAEQVIARPAYTNDFTIRAEAVAKPMRQMIDGQPGFLLHPDCRTTRIGMQGGYKFRRMQVAGDERYQNEPLKNAYSHPCEAGQYMHMGAGEGQALLRPNTAEGAADAVDYRAQRALGNTTSAADAYRKRRGLQ
jgi:hypothetical protein